jgi:hypothetical protein
MTIRNIADRDQVLAALRDARADLEAQRADLVGWLGLITMALGTIDLDLDDIQRTEHQLAAIRFDAFDVTS